MDFLVQLIDVPERILLILPAFLFLITLIVFIHELGHFLVARWCGVTVSVFSIGFGREIFGFDDRHGTRWRFAWIPLGGYVKFLDDENAASVPDRDALNKLTEEELSGAFQNKSLAARAAVVIAGPLANFILAAAIFALMIIFVGQRFTIPRVDDVVAGSAAQTAGFKVGDLVKTIDGEPIKSFNEMRRIVSINAGETLAFTVERGGTTVDLTVIPTRVDVKDRFGNVNPVGQLGVKRSASPDDWIHERHDPLTAVWLGIEETYVATKTTLTLLGRIITGREPADQLGGPIRIAKISGEMATLGFGALLSLAAYLSISIGLINLFPIPMLDGGHLVFYAVEAIRGRPLSDRGLEIGYRIGLTLVIMLMIFATWNDIKYMFGTT